MRRRTLLTWFACAVVVFCSVSILAQTGLPPGAPDAAGAFNGAGPSDLLNGYYASAANWVDSVKEAAWELFWALATIDFTWTCITLVLSQNELQGWFAGFIRKILSIGFFAALLGNGTEWVTAIVNFFINLGAHAGGRPVSELSASGIMGNGIELAGQMLHGAASVASNTNTSPIGLLVGGIGSFAPTIILALGAAVIVVAYILIALHFVMAMVEAYVVIGAGYIFLGFGGSRWTVPYTQKYLGMVVSAGVRIMVLELLIGMGSTLLPRWESTADAISKVPDIFSGSTIATSWSAVQAEFGLVASIIIYALLCWKIPQLAASVTSGGLSLSGGDALDTAFAAGTAAFAGASAAQSVGSHSSASQIDVAQIAQAAAIRTSEFGLSAAAITGTGGAGAAISGAAGQGTGLGLVEGAASPHGLVIPAPDSLSSAPNDVSAMDTSVPTSLFADLATVTRLAEPSPEAVQEQADFEKAVRDAGEASRKAVLQAGGSPQEAIRAERETKEKTAVALRQLHASRLMDQLDNALKRAPDPGGPVGGMPPEMDHSGDD